MGSELAYFARVAPVPSQARQRRICALVVIVDVPLIQPACSLEVRYR